MTFSSQLYCILLLKYTESPCYRVQKEGNADELEWNQTERSDFETLCLLQAQKKKGGGQKKEKN